MTAPLPIYAKLALGTAVVVAALAMAGSSVALYVIACAAQMALPLALPASLDLPAVVAATAIHARRRDPLAWFTLATATALSTALQVGAFPTELLARISHGAPPVAALLCFELAMRALRPTERTDKAKSKPAPKASEPIRNRPVPAPAVEAPPATEPEPAAPASALTDDEIAERVDVWLEQQDPPKPPTKPSVREAGIALDLPCRGSDRALAIAALVKARRSGRAEGRAS